MQHKTLILSGVLVHVAQELEREGPVYLLLHGRWADRNSFQTIIKFLDQEKKPWIVIDLPGFWQSANPPAHWWVKEYAECIQAYIQKMWFKHIVLVWHSFGGQIAVYLTQIIERDTLNAMILLAPAGIRKVDTGIGFRIKKTIFKIAKSILPQSITHKLKQRLWSSDYLLKPQLEEIFKRVIQEDLSYLLPHIAIPSYLIFAQDDQDVPLEDGKNMNQLIPDSQLIIVPWGHWDVLQFDIAWLWN